METKKQNRSQHSEGLHPIPSDFDITGFRIRLLNWFEQNLRPLPWREDKDPYKIWVSEMMLQQTRVDTVIPYFERFMERFPTLDELARAGEDEVLKYWEGLGYYSRARNLHQAVREVKEKYDGKVPDDPERISELKGVGPYTAGAILSIAYNRPEPAVDGNVMRVLSRLLLIEEDIQRIPVRKLFEQAVRILIDEKNPSYFNQALMELGALICMPRSPQCLTCPVMEDCHAFEQGKQTELPVKGKSKRPRDVNVTAGVVIDDGKLLIQKRPSEGLLAGLWQLPAVEHGEEHSPEKVSRHLYASYGIRAESVNAGFAAGSDPEDESWMSVLHTFSHLRWHMKIYQMHIVSREEEHLPPGAEWADMQRIGDYTFPVPYGKVINRLLENGY